MNEDLGSVVVMFSHSCNNNMISIVVVVALSSVTVVV